MNKSTLIGLMAYAVSGGISCVAQSLYTPGAVQPATNGRVGVGTATGTGLLNLYQPSGGYQHLVLDTGFPNGNTFAVNPFITGYDNGGFEIRDLTNGISRLVVQHNTGFVGIGTPTPQAMLHVYQGAIFNQSYAGAAYYFGGNANGGADSKYSGIGMASGGYIIFSRVSDALVPTEYARFTSAGYLGIGTQTPGAPLHLNGVGNGNLGTLRLDSPDNFTSITSRQSNVAGEPEGFTMLHTFYDSSNNILSLGGGLDEFNAATTLNFWTATDPTTRAGNIRMTIDHSGNVGIGTTSPGYKLSIETPANGLAFRAHSAGDFIFSLAGDGMAGSNVDLFSIRSNNTGAVHLNTINSARLALGVSTGTSAGSVVESMTITSSGNVGIGTANPTQKLSVNGTVRAKEVVVDTAWSDYVFDEHYRLAPLAEVEQHIKAAKHLPGIPSAREVEENGIGLGEIQAKLLAKIEEITLHQIRQEKEIEALKAENAVLKAKLNIK